MFCSNCGNEIPEDVEFCSSCGASTSEKKEITSEVTATLEVKDTSVFRKKIIEVFVVLIILLVFSSLRVITGLVSIATVFDSIILVEFLLELAVLAITILLFTKFLEFRKKINRNEVFDGSDSTLKQFYLYNFIAIGVYGVFALFELIEVIPYIDSDNIVTVVSSLFFTVMFLVIVIEIYFDIKKAVKKAF